MDLREKLKNNPHLGNALLVALGILFFASLWASDGSPQGFFKIVLSKLGAVVVAVAVVAAVIALGIRLGGNAQGAVSVQRQKQKVAKRNKKKKGGP